MKAINKEIEQRFKALLNEIELEFDDDYPNRLFYTKDNKIFFELSKNKKSEIILWCDYHLVWKVFETDYNFIDDDIQKFIKKMIDKYLGMNSVIPNVYFNLSFKR